MAAPRRDDVLAPGLFERIRTRCAEVAARAQHVRLDPAALEQLATRWADDPAALPAWDDVHHYRGEPGATLAFVFALDAVNFGSGWFPVLRKRPGCSGYFTIATSLTDRFEREGPLSAADLVAATPVGCAAIFGQDPGDPALAPLLARFARAWNELGSLVERQYDGRFEALVDAAAGSAEALVRTLARLPSYADVAAHGALVVPFLKRAQITVADLALAFDGAGPGAFRDLAGLTCFADNLVPHVLRQEGVLHVTSDLASRIERGDLIASGSPEEIELRAFAVNAVERLVAALSARGRRASAHELDHWLWHRGQRPEIKAHPRHRTRCEFY